MLTVHVCSWYMMWSPTSFSSQTILCGTLAIFDLLVNIMNHYYMYIVSAQVETLCSKVRQGYGI